MRAPLLSSLRLSWYEIRHLRSCANAHHPLDRFMQWLALCAPTFLCAGIVAFLLVILAGTPLLHVIDPFGDFGVVTGAGWDGGRIALNWLVHRDLRHLQVNAAGVTVIAICVTILCSSLPPAGASGIGLLRHVAGDARRAAVLLLSAALPMILLDGLLCAYVYPAGTTLIGASGVISAGFGMVVVDLAVRCRPGDARWLFAAPLMAACVALGPVNDLFITVVAGASLNGTSHLAHLLGFLAGVFLTTAHWLLGQHLPLAWRRATWVLPDAAEDTSRGLAV